MYCYSIPLHNYCNHKIFADHDEVINNISVGVSDFVLLQEADKEFLNYHGFQFIMPPKSSPYDNILCNNQIITFPTQYISYIGFLGFSEFGTCAEIFKLVDRNGFVKNINVIMKSIQSSSNNDNIANAENNKCKSAYIYRGSDDMKHHLYFWKKFVGLKTGVSQIIFPLNSTFHIMGVSLIG